MDLFLNQFLINSKPLGSVIKKEIIESDPVLGKNYQSFSEVEIGIIQQVFANYKKVRLDFVRLNSSKGFSMVSSMAQKQTKVRSRHF